MADELPPRPEAPLRLGISDCLLGSEVRYDGGHKRSSFPHEALRGLFEYQGFCPELAVGLGVPRQPIRLVGEAAQARSADPAVDSRRLNRDLRSMADAQAAAADGLAGYVFMKNSPSCGLYRVKVYPEQGAPEPRGRGIFAARLCERLPALPVEENGRLLDPVLRENFVTRCFAYAHWQLLVAAGLSARRLIAFHSRYKYLLMAHSVPHYQEAGRLLSDLSGNLAGIAGHYLEELMTGLARPATRKSHTNVLSHLQGYLKQRVDSASRQELARLIDAYRHGEQPLLAPIALLRHHLRRFPDAYVESQVYLEPHPSAAALRRTL